jgi:hypothetical protein
VEVSVAACHHFLLRSDAPNLVPLRLSKPDVACVGWPGRDAQRLEAKFDPTGCGQAKDGDSVTGGDAPDAISKGQGETHVTIRSSSDPLSIFSKVLSQQMPFSPPASSIPSTVQGTRKPCLMSMHAICN